VVHNPQNRLDPVIFGLCFIIDIGGKLGVELLELRHHLGCFIPQAIPMFGQDMIEIMVGEEALIVMRGT